MRLCLFISLLLIGDLCLAQTATIRGRVQDDNGTRLPQANVYIAASGLQTTTDKNGQFELEVPSGVEIVLESSYTAYRPYTRTLTLDSGEVRELNIILRIKQLKTVVIEDEGKRFEMMERIQPRLTTRIPNPTQGIESILLGQLGVVSNNELSSSYSVRGGSFDENLVYVNDIEVYRPFLTRSGQQEGLSFANPNMVSSILFSAGGFDAKYGDKMSSVLDIRYTRPSGREGSFTGGLLGGALHYGNLSKNNRTGYIFGLRYKTNQYLLGSLDEEGDYGSDFLDAQVYVTHGLSDRFNLEFLGNIAGNRYNFIPRTRTTQLGSINEALQLTVFFDGQEITQYDTYFGAFSLTDNPTKRLTLKYIASAYKTYEREEFDVLGQYRLDELERDLGSDEFGEVVSNIGIGGYLNHARNSLDATVLDFTHRAVYTQDVHTVQWGAGIRSEAIDDRLSEWRFVDSAGYSLPYSSNGPIVLDDLIKAENSIQSTRLQLYLQDNVKWTAPDSAKWDFTVGVRANHWTFNGQSVISPRGRISWRPAWTKTVGDSLVARDIIFKAAAGIYYQPPFYRELRRLDGSLNEDIEAQRSLHFLLGTDMMIQLFGRPFRLITEGYYKQYDALIPYELENVRLRYYATNNAKGFAYGLDTKLNGEFIPGVESWASLSFLSTKEDLLDDFYLEEDDEGNVTRVEPGFIPRNTDQRVTFSMFFQDEMPLDPSFKVQLSVHYGTGLPFGPPDFNRYRDTLRTPSYRRFDIGFSKQLIDDKTEFRNPNGFFSRFKEAWIALEVFNLLDVPNVQSYLWVKDVRGRQYSIPNFLTPRRLNVKLYFRF
ncbi:MAG: TonB-dependent receptor [Flavobacteriales bacterium]|nr:TonB-dependent receptor [Flavobacteriales bacterium]